MERRHGPRSRSGSDSRNKTSASRHHRKGSTSGAAFLSSSPGYVLEWSTGRHFSHAQQHRHILSSVEELRSELLAGGPAPGQGRLLVLRAGHRHDHLVPDVVDALVGVANVDGGFVTSHADDSPYRPRAKEHARSRGGWWCWKYPEVALTEGRSAPRQYRPGDGQVLTIARASLWLSSEIPILLVGHVHAATPQPQSRKTRPRLEHQDAATTTANFLPPGPPYGSVDSSSPKRWDTTTSFEEDVWSALMEDGEEDAVGIAGLVADLVYSRWVGCLSAMRLDVLHAQQEQKSLWRAMAGLEANLDETRNHARHGRQLDEASPPAWTQLIQRLELRIHLRQPTVNAEIQRMYTHQQQLRSHGDLSSPWSKSDNDRSLDRIAYLGGLLLPVTVVASILAIEGDYGPEGGNFWVFWLCSFIASVIAMLVIYVDQLRAAEVWLEIGEDDDDEEDDVGISGGGLHCDDAIRTRPSTMHRVRQRWTDGTPGATWKRAELGWAGAVKKLTGYYRWKRDPRLAFRRPGEVLRAKTFA